MSIKALGQKILQHPERFIRGVYSGIADTQNRNDGDGIVWTTGYVTGRLGPYGAVAAGAYLYAAGGCDLSFLATLL